MKKVKKIRGGNCDKANTNLVSSSNEITESNFIIDMQDALKRKRFKELLEKGKYEKPCLAGFLKNIEEELPKAQEILKRNTVFKELKEGRSGFDGPIAESEKYIGILNNLKTLIELKLGNATLETHEVFPRKDPLISQVNPIHLKRGGKTRRYKKRVSKRQ